MEIGQTLYIGDGVYLSFDGYHLVLRAGSNEIFLEDSVALLLMKFIKETFIKEENDD